jgi:hypothetical protein
MDASDGFIIQSWSGVWETWQEMMKCKMEAEKETVAIEKRRFLMFLI